MKWNVKLYVGGQVFTESVNAINTKMQRRQHLQEIQKQDLLVQMLVLKMTNCSP